MATIRRDWNLAKTSAAGNLQPSTSYKINVYPKGAISNGAATFSGGNTTFNVYAGHGFSVNQMLMVGTDTTKTAYVTSAPGGGTTVVVAGDLHSSVTTANIVIANLGLDIGPAGTPQFTETPSPTIPIYNDYAATSAISGSLVTADANGDYGYYSDAATQKWEIIRNAAGAVQAVIKDTTPLSTGIPSIGSSLDNQVALWSGTGGGTLKASTVTIATGAVAGVTSLTATGNISTSGNISTTGSGTMTSAGALTVTTGGATITAGGLTVTAGNVNTGTGTVTMPGAVSATTTLGVTGISTLTGGIAGGKPYNIRTWQNILATDGTNATATFSPATLYYASIFIPMNCNVKGVQFLIGNAGGTDKVIGSLYNASGTLVANSAVAGTTVGTAATIQQLDFVPPNNPYAAIGPGYYFIGIMINGGTCRFRTIPANTNGGAVSGSTTSGQSFGTPANISSPSTSFTADVGPIASLYA